MDKQQIQAEALNRATAGESWANYPAIFEGFGRKGIPEADIKPRENVFTYDAWKALGRQVRRGEHGVRVNTVVSRSKEVDDGNGGTEQKTFRFPKPTTVFHISQTDPMKDEPIKRMIAAPEPYELKPEPKPTVYKSPVTNREMTEEDLDREYRKLFPSNGGEV